MKKFLVLSIALACTAGLIAVSAGWDNTDSRQLMSKINSARTQEAFKAALSDLYKTYGDPDKSNKGTAFLNNALRQWESNGFDTASFLTYADFVEQNTPAAPTPICPTCQACAPCTECPPAVECPECPPAPVCPTCAVCPEPTVCPEPEHESAPVAPAPAPVETPATPLAPEAFVEQLVAQVEQTAELVQNSVQDPVLVEQISDEQLKSLRAALSQFTKALRALKKTKE